MVHCSCCCLPVHKARLTRKMLFYKDSYGINHRSAIQDKLKELSLIVAENNYDEVLLPHPRKRYPHQDEHTVCTMPENESQERITEKRICRCWNYFNKANNDYCEQCGFGFKRKNAGSIEIVDYEVPTVFSMEQLGGIDWLLKKDAEIIAAEVKPPNSSETIVRMITEILTYTIGTSYAPAICFFKTDMFGNPSKQYVDYIKVRESDAFKSIEKNTGLRVFYITFDENTFVIHDVKDDPCV